MSDLDELRRAREDLAAALDARDIPEWRAIRAIDRAISSLSASPRPHLPRPLSVKVTTGPGITYTGLARSLIQSKGSPATTPEVVEFIRSKRHLDPDGEKAKINITTSLSKDPHFASIPWMGGRAWWLPELGEPTPDGRLKLDAPS